MKKEDLLAMGLSEELAAKVAEASAAEMKGYVTRDRMNEVIQERDQLKEQKKEADAQLETLKAAAGENEALKTQISQMQSANQEKEAEFQNQLKDLQVTNAIKLAISGSAQDSDLVAGLIDKTKLVIGDDGKVVGLDEQVSALKESKAFLFKSEDTTKGGNGGGGFSFGARRTPEGGSAGREGGQLSMKEAIAAKINAQMGQKE